MFEKFRIDTKRLNEMLASQMSGLNKEGLSYNGVTLFLTLIDHMHCMLNASFVHLLGLLLDNVQLGIVNLLKLKGLGS